MFMDLYGRIRIFCIVCRNLKLIQSIFIQLLTSINIKSKITFSDLITKSQIFYEKIAKATYKSIILIKYKIPFDKHFLKMNYF